MARTNKNVRSFGLRLPSETLLLPLTPYLKGVAEAVLYCAHQAMHRSSIFSIEGGLDGLPLRVSNEGLPRPRVARAQETI
jgi:hypothetical protein